MATPKAVQSASTPKNPLSSTPSRVNASPRPNPSALGNKTLPNRSPAVKTPTSTQGHSYRVSVSSQPNSTPLAAPAIHDELLNLNSPAAALIASIGNAGLTPLATGQDGLGITTGITPQGGRDGPLASRNPEVERLSRLEQVAKLLKTKIAGRGITREGVERVAQVQGFTILWDEENLTIAGNSVDLEIIFDALERHVVRDVQLRLNTSGSEEPQLQKDASEVLKKHLNSSDHFGSTVDAWKSLEDFSVDLEYLSGLDYIGSTTNCFELVGGLYNTFHKIWDEEKQKMRDRRRAHHACQGNIGKPMLDRDGHLGITSQYWVDKHMYKAAADISEPSAAWKAHFTCEKGISGVRADQNWLAEEPLRSTPLAESALPESHIEKPNWTDDASVAKVDGEDKDAGAMILDEPAGNMQNSLDVVFVCQLEPLVMVPINVAAELNSQYRMLELDQSNATTYQQALLNASKHSSNMAWHADLRWDKSLSVIDRNGIPKEKTHSYALFSNGILWSYPVEQLRFAHPRHYAEALPILRQFAVLWSLLRNTLIDGSRAVGTDVRAAVSPAVARQDEKLSVKRRSNKKTAQGKLDIVLSVRQADGEGVRVDMSLDVITDPARARLELIIPVPSQAQASRVVRFMHVVIEVRRDGVVDISSISGSPRGDEVNLKQKATKVLGLSEDISVLIEWLLSEVGYAS